MRKEKLVLVFVLLTLLVGVGLGTVGASPAGPEVVPGLNGPVSEWADVDLEQLVEMAVNEEISIPAIRVIVEQMTEKQITRIGELLAIRAGVWDEWRQSADEIQESSGESQGEIACKATLSGGYAWGCYPVEYNSGVWFWKHADYYYSSVECNGGDEDWIFMYGINYASNPDGLRWRTNSSRVYLAFLPLGLNLNSFGHNFWTAELVIGKTRVSMAGGPDWVRDHLFMEAGY